MSGTAAQIIDSKGGSSAVASDIGKTAGAVRVWKHRNLIPRDAWPDLMTTYSDITLAMLIEAERLGSASTVLAAQPAPELARAG